MGRLSLTVMGTLLISLSFSWPPAFGASTAGDLLAACNNAAGSTSERTCNAYINGYVNGILADQIATEQGDPICADRTNTDLVRGAFRKFMSEHADAAGIDASAVLAFAIGENSPCQKAR